MSVLVTPAPAPSHGTRARSAFAGSGGSLGLATLLARAAGLAVGIALPVLLYGYVALTKLGRAGQLLAVGPGAGDLAHLLGHYALISYYGACAAFLGVVAVLFVVRKRPVLKLRRLPPQVAAVLGSYVMTVVALQPPDRSPWWLTVSAGLLLVLGMACAVATLLVLGRCFGILPEARGLITSGPYRYVRHPLYTAEALSFLGLLLPVLSPLTLAVYLAFLALQALRTRYEEEVLFAAFPEYAAYRRSTWRFIPGVW